MLEADLLIEPRSKIDGSVPVLRRSHQRQTPLQRQGAHGAQFDVKTGKAVGDARVAFIKMRVKDVESFPVKVEGTDILVGLD